MRSLKSILVGVVALGGACDVGEWSGGDVLPLPAPTEEVGLVAGRYVVVAGGLERYGFALESAEQCGADIGIEIPHIFAFSAELSVACVEVFLQIPGIVVELDSTMMVQGDDVLEAPGVNEDNFAAMPRGAYRIGADALWRDGYFGAGVRVALIDTGIDCAHQEFSWLMHEGIVVDAVQGYSFGAHCVDANGHGTAVAGLLAAAHDGVGVRGMAPAMMLYSVKAFNTNGVGNYSAVAAGIVWAVGTKNVDIVLLPFGGFYDSVAVLTAISYARSHGTVIVAAAGNTQETMFPARAEGVIGVGAIDDGDFSWSLSAQGEGVDVVASGAYEFVSLPENSYAYMSGTSLAAARVAGGLALVISRLPMLNPAAIDDFLVRTSDDLGEIGWDEEFGYGVMSIPSVLRMAEIGWKM